MLEAKIENPHPDVVGISRNICIQKLLLSVNIDNYTEGRHIC